MMGIGPEEAGRMNLWTYQALLWNWNQMHDPDAKREPGEPEDRDRLSRFHRANKAKRAELN
jgi:hypothetical protein